jgi:hypothetical protein
MPTETDDKSLLFAGLSRQDIYVSGRFRDLQTTKYKNIKIHNILNCDTIQNLNLTH